MTQYADFELSLSRGEANRFTVQMRYDILESDVHIHLSPGTHTLAFRFNELALNHYDPLRHGRLLAEDLFANEEIMHAFIRARQDVQSRNLILRFRLFLASDLTELHALCWETLCDPKSGHPLFTGERILFSRMLFSSDWRSLDQVTREDLKVVIAVASPENLESYQLSPIDRGMEQDRALMGTAEWNPIVAPAILSQIVDHMRDGCDLLYLVCHGSLVRGESWLWLEDQDGMAHRVKGSQLADQIASLQTPPRLVVLISCQSAGAIGEHPLCGLDPNRHPIFHYGQNEHQKLHTTGFPDIYLQPQQHLQRYSPKSLLALHAFLRFCAIHQYPLHPKLLSEFESLPMYKAMADNANNILPNPRPIELHEHHHFLYRFPSSFYPQYTWSWP